MREKYTRTSFEVEAVRYELDKGMEDGFKPWMDIVTNGWIVTEGLIQITRPDGVVVCPFLQNRRGLVFIREGDYIIYDEGGERHCCGSDKFPERYKKASD